MTRVQKTLSEHRKKLLPGLVTLSLLAGIVVSIVATTPSSADYNTGCGYGYNSAQGGFGYGTGIAYGYGFGYGGTFAYGYGNTVCPISFTPTTLNSGMASTYYTSQSLVGQGGVGPYTFAVTSGSADGLALSPSGTFSGTPTSSGNYAPTVTMTDGNGQIVSEAVSFYMAPYNGGGGGGGGATTTTSSTTTTLGTTTTTTTSKGHVCNLFAVKFFGFAVVGKSINRAITGGCFYAQPNVTSNEVGTRVGVLHDNGRVLIVRVTVPAGSPVGWHNLTITEPNGMQCKVNYFVRNLG